MPARPMTAFEAFRDTYRNAERRKMLVQTPVVMSEGDSWFAFPLDNNNMLDVVTTLVPGLYLRLEKNGDEAEKMFAQGSRNLDRIGEHLRTFHFDAVLISAGGNDIVGDHLKDLFEHAAPTTPRAAVDQVKAARFEIVRSAYRNLIATVRENSGANPVPILAHTYDYPVRLGKAATLDPAVIGLIGFLVPKVGDWIGRFVRGILPDGADQLEFVRLLLDAFWGEILVPLQQENPDVFHYCDLLGTLGPDPSLWHDELHPADDGFWMLGEKFAAQMLALIPREKWPPADNP